MTTRRDNSSEPVDDDNRAADDLTRANEMGPLPGISDDADADDADGAPIGERPHDEAKEVIGFNGVGR
jgi:hypothetical protein